jgi:hypothetical protein
MKKTFDSLLAEKVSRDFLSDGRTLAQPSGLLSERGPIGSNRHGPLTLQNRRSTIATKLSPPGDARELHVILVGWRRPIAVADSTGGGGPAFRISPEG